MKKTYTRQEVIDIIDIAIKEANERKNKYIEKNGFKHIEVIKRFDTEKATLLYLISRFERN